MRGLLSALFLGGGVVALWVLFDPGPHLVDSSLLDGLSRLRGEEWNEALILFTHLGGHHVMIPVCGGLVFLVAWRDRANAPFLALSWASSALTNEGLKRLVSRPRPVLVEALTSPRGLSFPSGHSQASMAFALGVVVLLHRRGVPVRNSIWLLLFPLCIGVSRVYLGVHYPTDVFAGWCFGAFIVLLTHFLLAKSVDSGTQPAGPSV